MHERGVADGLGVLDQGLQARVRGRMLHVGDVQLEVGFPFFEREFQSGEGDGVVGLGAWGVGREGGAGTGTGAGEGGGLRVDGFGELGEAVEEGPEAFGEAEDIVDAAVGVDGGGGLISVPRGRRGWVFFEGEASCNGVLAEGECGDDVVVSE